ncbi:MAG TPA: TniB family NTP-binding protein [Nocardioides sp.]|nr:TniB family NTP-binding protein [Nocardioides sp.]
MDAEMWHHQATAPMVAAPQPATADDLAAMSPMGRSTYADAVRAALRARRVSSPVHDATANAIDCALESAVLEPPGARTILALSAPYTAGKSTLIKSWAQDRYRTWAKATRSTRPRWTPAPGITADLVPVCYLTLLSESRSKDLYTQILSFVGYPASGVERTLALRAVKALQTHGVRLVILDDAHMLRSTSVTGRATLNAVKHLNTELGEVGGVLMLVGAELTGGDVLSDPQIRGRLSEHTLAPYEVDTATGRAQWQRFLKNCEDLLLPYLPDVEPGLFSSRLAGYLWRRTQGYVGDTTRLLIDATATAIETGAPLDRAILDPIWVSQRAQDAQIDHTRSKTTRRAATRRASR